MQKTEESILMQRKSIVVLGMHRSGTSALARMLNFLGCELPKTLMPEAPSNPKGHWESNAIMALNDAILESAGTSWSDWLEFNPTWYESPVVDGFRQRAVEVLHEEYGSSSLFVLKDPRNCRLTRFWFEVLDMADATPLVVIPLRNPLEVMDSLEARDGMHRDIAMLLWLRHVLDAEHGSRNQKRVFLTYESLLDDWANVATQMQDVLDISWPRFSFRTSMDVEAFLDRDSRHHVRPEQSVRSNLMISKWLRDTDTILRRWAETAEDSRDHAALDEIRLQLNAAGPAFANLTHAVSNERYQNVELRNILQAKESEISKLRNEVVELSEKNIISTDKNDIINNLTARIEQLQHANGQLESERSAFQADLESVREHAALVDSQLISISAEKEEKENALHAADNNIAILKAELAEYQHNLGSTQSTLRQREEEIAQTLSTLAEERQQLAQAEASRATDLARLQVIETKLQNADAWIFKIAGERKENEDRVIKLQIKLASTEKALNFASERLTDIESRYLHPDEKSKLIDQLNKITDQSEKFRIEAEGARHQHDVATSEVISLSKLLQSQRIELAKNAAMKAELETRESELTTLLHELRVQAEEAQQGLSDSKAEVIALSKLLLQRQTHSAQSASVKSHLDDGERELSVVAENLRIQAEEAKQGWSTAKAEVLALSKLLVQRQDATSESVLIKAQIENRESELVALSEDLRLQAEEARQGWATAKSEILALSKLVQQRQGGSANAASMGDVKHLSNTLKVKQEEADQNARHAKWLEDVNAIVTGYPQWWALAPKKYREKWQNGRLLRRGLFDAESYLARYPDVASSDINPLRHYIIHGIRENRTF